MTLDTISTQDYEALHYEFWRIMYYLGKGNTKKSKALHKALDDQSKAYFIDWLEDTYFYEQFDNDDTESLPEIIAMFQQG